MHCSASTRALGSRSSFHEGPQNLAQPAPLRTRGLRAQNRPSPTHAQRGRRGRWAFTGLFLSRRFCAFGERAGTATPNSPEPKTAEGSRLHVKKTSRWNKLREGVGVGSAGVSRCFYCGETSSRATNLEGQELSVGRELRRWKGWGVTISNFPRCVLEMPCAFSFSFISLGSPDAPVNPSLLSNPLKIVFRRS